MTSRSMTAHRISLYGIGARRLTGPDLPATTPEQSRDGLQFKLIFSFCLAFYLVAAMLARLDPRFWRRVSLHRSAFVEAWEASGTTARIAFSG